MKKLRDRKGPNIYWKIFKLGDISGHLVPPVLYIDFDRVKESRHSEPFYETDKRFDYDKDEFYFRIGSYFFKSMCFELTFTPNQREWLKYANQEWSGYEKLIDGALLP